MTGQVMAVTAMVFIVALVLSGLTLQVYGLLVCFSKKWYFGVLALIIPGFAMGVGAGKILGKDFLK